MWNEFNEGVIMTAGKSLLKCIMTSESKQRITWLYVQFRERCIECYVGVIQCTQVHENEINIEV